MRTIKTWRVAAYVCVDLACVCVNLACTSSISRVSHINESCSTYQYPLHTGLTVLKSHVYRYVYIYIYMYVDVCTQISYMSCKNFFSCPYTHTHTHTHIHDNCIQVWPLTLMPMSHISVNNLISHFSHINESCLSYQWVMSNISTSITHRSADREQLNHWFVGQDWETWLSDKISMRDMTHGYANRSDLSQLKINTICLSAARCW